ncbi:MAG: thioredoxin domain-containing protein, partial [Acidobacteria bacterium]|nr:thioredoxin domain-containing protein [Acidobacteriota bacterium]
MQRQNRLAQSRSPYLLQHADNPVDWYPWGEEAFSAARDQDKPIFLSIGYATCHWCHVMAHESFEDPEVAALMNEVFINIKVDREERPDIDQVYMTVTQMLTGRGGWPMTVIMTPDKRPFFAATYIPKNARFGRMGMMDLIPKVQAAWQNDRPKLLESAGQIVANLQTVGAQGRPGDLDAAVISTARRDLGGRYDAIEGGFGTAPKFPSPHNLLFLLAYGEAVGDDKAIDMVSNTLKKMRQGGIFDHVGFGFHRYSTDKEWLVPHFEKMLYDQAMLLLAFTEAYRLTGREEFADTAREVIEYVDRDLKSSDGAFFSAEDADSEGEEGVFYLWTEEQLIEVLGKDDASIVHTVWNTTPTGNFLPEASAQASIDNILHLKGDLGSIAKGLELSEIKLRTRLDRIRLTLLESRAKRPRPLLDDKVLTDWNGLMA